MKLLLTTSFLAVAFASNAAVFSTNLPDKDAFVRALATNFNYGGGGALSISGSAPTTGNPTNGAFDTFMSFNTMAIVTNFNAVFGSNNWVITSATLNLTENPSPGNPVFNYGTGMFQISYITNDSWTEGTGSPNTPTTNGISYSLEADYTNASDVNLGTFTFSGAAKLSCPFSLPTAFVTNLESGGEIGLFMTAVSPQIGFVFYSRQYAGNPAALPALVVGAMAQPSITSVSASGTNIVLTATNGFAGATYNVLTATDLTMPASQWTAIATNVPSSSGAFMITLTNAVGTNFQQFFILQTY